LFTDLAGHYLSFSQENVFLSGNDIWDTCRQKIISKKMKYTLSQSSVSVKLVFSSYWVKKFIKQLCHSPKKNQVSRFKEEKGDAKSDFPQLTAVHGCQKVSTLSLQV